MLSKANVAARVAPGLRSMAMSAAEAWSASGKDAGTVGGLIWKNELARPKATAFRGFMAENESLWSFETLSMQANRLAMTMISYNVLAQKSTVALWSDKHIEHFGVLMSSALMGVRLNLVDDEETDATKISKGFGADMALLVFDPKSRALDKAQFVREHIPQYAHLRAGFPYWSDEYPRLKLMTHTGPYDEDDFNHLYRLLPTPPPATEYDDLYLLPAQVKPDFELVQFPDGTVWTHEEGLSRARKFASDHKLQAGEAVVLDAKASSKAAVMARLLPLVSGCRLCTYAGARTADSTLLRLVDEEARVAVLDSGEQVEELSQLLSDAKGAAKFNNVSTLRSGVLAAAGQAEAKLDQAKLLPYEG